MENTEKILDLMSKESEPLKSGEIATKLNIDKKDVDSAIKKLLKEDKIFVPKRCFYSKK